MGVMAPPKPQTTSPTMKRRSGQVDFSGLGPLKTSGTVGFTAFRDRDSQPTSSRKSRKSNGASESTAMDADSDDDDDDDSAEILSKMEDIDSKDDKSKLRPDDGQFSGELADGVNRIRVCRLWSPVPWSYRKLIRFLCCSSSEPTRPIQTAPPALASPLVPVLQHRPNQPSLVVSPLLVARPGSLARASRTTATLSVAPSRRHGLAWVLMRLLVEATRQAEASPPRSAIYSPRLRLLRQARIKHGLRRR